MVRGVAGKGGVTKRKRAAAGCAVEAATWCAEWRKKPAAGAGRGRKTAAARPWGKSALRRVTEWRAIRQDRGAEGFEGEPCRAAAWCPSPATSRTTGPRMYAGHRGVCAADTPVMGEAYMEIICSAEGNDIAQRVTGKHGAT